MRLKNIINQRICLNNISYQFFNLMCVFMALDSAKGQDVESNQECVT